jgi:hypothetical protein
MNKRAAGPEERTCRIAALLFFFLAAALPLSGQSVKEVLSRGRYSLEVREQVVRQFEEAKGQGVPVGLLLPRLEEGVAKKVPGERLLAVLRREQELLLEARRLLLELDGGSKLTEDQASWSRVANLLAGGYGRLEVQELARVSLARARDFRPAASLYVSLRTWGLDSEQALDIVRGLLASSISGDRFPGVMEILVEGRRQRISPETLLQRMQQYLPQVKSIEDLRQKCLQ